MDVRYRCASLGYSLGMGIIGGSAPLIAGILSTSAYKHLLLSTYFSLSGVLAILALWTLIRKIPLNKNALKPVLLHTV